MKIAVIGAGIVGVTTAHELAVQGHQVVVFERHAAVASETQIATSSAGASVSSSSAGRSSSGRHRRSLLLSSPIPTCQESKQMNATHSSTPPRYLARERERQHASNQTTILRRRSYNGTKSCANSDTSSTSRSLTNARLRREPRSRRVTSFVARLEAPQTRPEARGGTFPCDS